MYVACDLSVLTIVTQTVEGLEVRALRELKGEKEISASCLSLIFLSPQTHENISYIP